MRLIDGCTSALVTCGPDEEPEEEEPAAEEEPLEEEEAEDGTEEEVVESSDDTYAEDLDKLIEEGADGEVLLAFTFDWMARQPISTARQVPLLPIVEGISETGELTITFTNQMLVPPESGATGVVLDSIIGLKVVSSFHALDSELIAIDDYHLVYYGNQTLVIQVDFLNPNHISMDPIDKD